MENSPRPRAGQHQNWAWKPELLALVLDLPPSQATGKTRKLLFPWGPKFNQSFIFFSLFCRLMSETTINFYFVLRVFLNSFRGQVLK